MWTKKLSTGYQHKKSPLFIGQKLVFHTFQQLFVVDKMLKRYQQLFHMWKVLIS